MKLRAGAHWQPSRIERVSDVLSSSTKPLFVVTDLGSAVLKYMGNPQGPDALVAELIAGELAARIGLGTPDFAVLRIPEIPTRDPFVTAQAGPAFLSRWVPAATFGDNSMLLQTLREPGDIARLVVFDTWIRNKDRFPGTSRDADNLDNMLIVPDKLKCRLLALDHSHAFAETTLEEEICEGWSNEEHVYGLFKDFVPMLRRRDLDSAIEAVCALALVDLKAICRSPPAEWGFRPSLADRLAELLCERAASLRRWLPAAIFDQMEFDL